MKNMKNEKLSVNTMKNSRVVGIGLIVFGVMLAFLSPYSRLETGESAPFPVLAMALLFVAGGIALTIKSVRLKKELVNSGQYDEKISITTVRNFQWGGMGLLGFSIIAVIMSPQAKMETGEPAPLFFLGIALIFFAGSIICFITSASKMKKLKALESNDSSIGTKGSVGIDGFHAQTRKIAMCQNLIATYLYSNKSTPFFREKLTAAADRLRTFGSRCGNIQNMLVNRFGLTGLSYGKFAVPVLETQEYLIGLVDDFITRMRLFNEEEYSVRIKEFTETNRIKDAEAYEGIEREYKAYAENLVIVLDDTILKFDRLILELSKIDETDINKAMDIMRNLEDAIKDTQFYK